MCLAMMAELSISGFPGGSVGKESTCNAGDTRDMGSFPGLGRYPGGGPGECLGQRRPVGYRP